jgi:hypothetical protein
MPALVAMAVCLLAVCPTLAFAQGATPVLVAQIAGNLNTKSAKVGDTLIAKTVRSAKLNDGTLVPKGSQLIGTVVAVQSKQAGNGTSKVAIKFDRIQVKDGASHPIQGRIAAIGMVSGMGGDSTDGSLMARGGPTATSGLGPQSGTPQDSSGSPGDAGAVGSSLKGVILGLHLDDAGASDLEGVNSEIKLGSADMIKVELE